MSYETAIIMPILFDKKFKDRI
ncbi:MAG: hypothetical protein RI946_2353, partial [Pseudomonadota bacterium]